MAGQAGRQRVERFQVYARTRSINEGAARLSTTTPVLLSQLVQLERACAGTLIERSTRRHDAQRLSPLGERLPEQADQHLGPKPRAPTEPPEPLTSALSSFWGALWRFEVAARPSSLVEAAADFGTNVHAEPARWTSRTTATPWCAAVNDGSGWHRASVRRDRIVCAVCRAPFESPLERVDAGLLVRR